MHPSHILDITCMLIYIYKIPFNAKKDSVGSKIRTTLFIY